MKTFPCICGNHLYFENSVCLHCQRETGWCPNCQGIRAILPQQSGGYCCGHCGTHLLKCFNYSAYSVCNRMVVSSKERQMLAPLCDCCRFNETIPDLSVPGNAEKWYRLEVAKRRLFYNLNLVRLPYGTKAEGFELPLSFDFKAHVIPAEGYRRNMTEDETVYTGHADGKITINIQEADPVAREKLRVDMGESHRTLIGHFHHEIGHYYWQLLVQWKDEQAFKAVFGDHQYPNYGGALNYYYQYGPKPYWQGSYISAYATMHPWEDFAETFGAYLDMVALLDTAENASLLFADDEDYSGSQFDGMLERYRQLGIKLNEMNRALGLIDLVPAVFFPIVANKMRFIHRLVKRARKMDFVRAA